MQFRSKRLFLPHLKVRWPGETLIGAPGGYHRDFSDAEDLSHVLSNVDVSAVQTGRGPFHAHLSKHLLQDWAIQSIAFRRGGSACAGSASPDRHSILVPLALGRSCRLLGKELSQTEIGVYAPRSEHADVSSAGLWECVVTTPAGFLDKADRLGLAIDLPLAGSTLRSARPDHLQPLSSILRTIIDDRTGAGPVPEAVRSLTETFELILLQTIAAGPVSAASGRPKVPRAWMFSRLIDYLEEHEDEPVLMTDLALALEVSYPTLRRIFLEWVGMPPTRYLLLKRMYLARKRLQGGAHAKVSDVATSCGFWEFGRFAACYRKLFGESPSETLSRNPKQTGAVSNR